MILFLLGRIENIVGKRRKCWLSAFAPFPTLFSKDFYLRVVQSRDCVVDSEICPIPGYDRRGRAIRPKRETAVRRNSYTEESK